MAIVEVGDRLLGWLLHCPRDLSLLLLAFGTALLMTLARRAVTNQDLLRRCAADLKQLKRPAREARLARDTPRQKRLKATTAMIRETQLVADLKVLAAMLAPIAAIAMWAVERFDYLPPRVGDELVLRANFAISSVDGLTHLVPSHGFDLRSPAIQRIQSDGQSPPAGFAEWRLSLTGASDDLALTIRHREESAVHHVAVGRPTYLSRLVSHGNERIKFTKVLLTRYWPLGLNLQSKAIDVPPWMIGYLALTLPLVPALKRLFRVA